LATHGYRTLLRNGNVKLLVLAYSINVFAVSYLIGYYLNITLASIGGPALVGLFATVGNVFSGFLPVVAGALADSHGRRSVILVSAVFEILALLALVPMASSGDRLIVLPAVVFSASFIASFPELFSLMGELAPQDAIGKAMSLLFIASSAAGILSHISFGSLIGRISNSRLFVLSALFVFGSIPFYFRVSETMERKDGGAFERFREALKGVTLLKESLLKLFMVYLCFELFVSFIASPFVPLFLQRVYSLSVSQISFPFPRQLSSRSLRSQVFFCPCGFCLHRAT